MIKKQTTVTDIGEFGLIERIQKIVPNTVHPDVVLSIGDDTAVFKKNDSVYYIATCDIQIQNTHFRIENTTHYNLGRRAMAVNLSDIASMGGTPLFALVSLGIPPNIKTEHFEQLYKGLCDQIGETGGHIIGGNLSKSSDIIIIDIFLLGEVEASNIIYRKGAQPGDRIFVTGHLGSSAAGFSILENENTALRITFPELVEAHLLPQPQMQTGRQLALSGYVTAMLDISDGLAGDLMHLCKSSGVGAQIYQNKLPISNSLTKAASLLSKDTLNWSLYGGEDYQLLFTVKPDTPASVIEEISKKTKLTEIGTIISDKKMWLVDEYKNKQQLFPDSWDHFK